MAHTRPAGWRCALLSACIVGFMGPVGPVGLVSLAGFAERVSAQTEPPVKPAKAPSSPSTEPPQTETPTLPADEKTQGEKPTQADSQPEPFKKPIIHRPKAAQRIVKIFNFEERISSAIDIPEGWVRAQNDEKVPRIRPGFPIWNGAKLDFRMAAQGKGSIRIPIDGGSASLRLKTGELPIFAGAKYAIRVMVRAEGLVNARPRIVVRALDAKGVPIPQSQRSVLVMHPTQDWQPIEVQLPGIFKNAAYMQIDLEVVQEREFRKPTMGKHQVWREDYNASAWFDELVVLQVPQVTLATTSPLNIVTRPDSPTITATVRDLAAQHMTATFRLYDATRTPIDSTTQPIASSKTILTWQPTISELGWYRVVIDISADKKIIATKTSDFVWLAQPAPANHQYKSGPALTEKKTSTSPDTSRAIPFGLTLSKLPPVSTENLPRVLQDAGVSTVTLPIWQASLTTDTVAQQVDTIRSMVDALREVWISPILSLPVVPDELAQTLGIQSTDVLDSLHAPKSQWEPYLLDALDRLGNTDASWQLGSPSVQPNTKDPNYQSKLADVHRQLAKLVPSLLLELAWRADQSPAFLDASRIRSVRMGVPPWLSAQGMKPLVETWKKQSPALSPTYVFETENTAAHHERDVAADLARRFVIFWAALTEPAPAASEQENTTPARLSVSLANPWTTEQSDHPATNPHVSLAAWRQLADRFTDRAFATKWDIVPGVQCYIFTPAQNTQDSRGGLIVLWNQTAQPDPTDPTAQLTLMASLGQSPITIYDIFGNARTISPTTTQANTRSEYSIPFGPEPIFIEGADTNLAIFLASITLDPPIIESVTGEHTYEIILHNPWPIPIAGRLVISKPGGYNPQTQIRDRTWNITPHTIDFDIPAKDTTKYPILLSFSQSIEAGPQPLTFDIKLNADKEYDWVQTTITPTVEWHDILFDLAYHPAKTPLGIDLVVEASITNLGSEPRSFEATAFAPGFPRKRASVGSLEPGQLIIRRFIFNDGYATLAGQKVFISLSDLAGSNRQNKSIKIQATFPSTPASQK